MMLPNAAILRRLTEKAWTKRSRDERGLLDRVNSVQYSILRRAEEAAKLGFKSVCVWAMTARNADDVEVLERVVDELLKMGFGASWEWTGVKINDAQIKVSWFTKRI